MGGSAVESQDQLGDRAISLQFIRRQLAPQDGTPPSKQEDQERVAGMMKCQQIMFVLLTSVVGPNQAERQRTKHLTVQTQATIRWMA